jgi:ssRNA-specific RNase YbeY (16S rRNA maturation enzyme)
MNKLNQGYYKIWKNDFYTIEANIVRSLWEDKYIKSFEKRLNKIILEIFENSKNNLLENNILISILFTGDKKVAELNNYYRKIQKPTNVLSFPSKEINNSNEMFLGYIVFSSQTII